MQSKTVLESGLHAVDSGFQVLDSSLCQYSGTWIPDSNRWGDSGFLELYSRFQSPRFQIPQAIFFRILDSTSIIPPHS